jgi:hypothetical protein
MHTETNFVEKERGDEAGDWLWKQWSNLIAVRNSGVPVVGFTWYSLHDQIDWDIALRKKTGNIHAVGLYDSTATFGPPASPTSRSSSRWRHVLPAQSACLQLPIVEADEWEEPWAVRRRAQMRELRRAGGEPRL